MAEEVFYFRVGPLRACENGHLCHPLYLCEEVPNMSQAKRIPLWAEGNEGTNEGTLQRALACSDEVLSLLAEESEKPSLVVREIGGSGNMDIAVFFGNMTRVLLLDCKNSEPANLQKLKNQRDQANRLALSTLANIRPRPQAVKMVLLAGWSRNHEEVAPGEHLPGWMVSLGEWSRVPSGELWGLVPFVLADDSQPWGVIGRWSALSSCDWPPNLRRSASNKQNRCKVDHGKKVCMLRNGVNLREDSPILFTMRVPQEEYKKAARDYSGQSTVRSLLDRAYAGDLNVDGVEFLGENNEKGNVRLCFECSPPRTLESIIGSWAERALPPSLIR